jgi:hypothetical protein
MIYLRGSRVPGSNDSFSDRWRSSPNLIAGIFCFGGTIMVLFYLVRVYSNFFPKQWKPTSKTSRKSGKTEIDFTSPFNSPELLELKKDLW